MRVFQIDITSCTDCGGTLRFIAAIMERSIVEKILTHLGLPAVAPVFRPPRAPPQACFWGENLA